MLRRFLHGTFSSLRNRNYRLYFIGQSISVSGTFMQTVAQAWLVLELTGSGTQLGIVTALQYLPMLVLAPFGGVLVDRVSKRRLILITQMVSGLQAFVFWLVVASGITQLWMIYVLATILGVANAIDNPARNSFVLDLVGRKDVPNAISLNSIQFNISRIVGPAIAGVLIVTLGLPFCFFLNAVSFIAVITCLLLMRPSEFHASPTVDTGQHPLREGLSYVWSTPVLRNTVIMLGIIGTLTYEFPVSLPLFAEYTLHGGPDGFSLLMSTMGIGAVIGGLLVARRTKVIPAQMMIIALLFGCSIIVASMMPTLIVPAVGGINPRL
ncbi:MAG: MFS transporter [Candidatus Peregrinibacteria bacterium]